MTKEIDEVIVKPKEKAIMFFFGIIFVLILGKHYFANLGGRVEAKSQLLKWYYFGLIFWFVGHPDLHKLG